MMIRRYDTFVNELNRYYVSNDLRYVIASKDGKYVKLNTLSITSTVYDSWHIFDDVMVSHEYIEHHPEFVLYKNKDIANGDIDSGNIGIGTENQVLILEDEMRHPNLLVHDFNHTNKFSNLKHQPMELEVVEFTLAIMKPSEANPSI